MEEIVLKFGRQSMRFLVPESAQRFEIIEPRMQVHPLRFKKKVSDALKALNPCVSTVAIVVADKTRLCGYEKYLPILLDTLVANGADPQCITFFIAYGTHFRQSEATSRAIYGKVYERFRFVHHDCDDNDCFVHLGTTFRGTPVMFRREILDATFLITFGAISHHYFAGFGGGRKLIFPGLGYRDAIYHNHGLFLDRATGVLSNACQPGAVIGNPLAEDLAAVEAFRPADLAIHGILNSYGQVCDLRIGLNRAHFQDACAVHADNCEVVAARPFKRVLAACGGHPKDINFIQSHKALHNAAAFVQDGGELILLASCPDGIGSTSFLSWFGKGSRQAAFKTLSCRYSGNGGTALSMMSKIERIRVALVTRLSQDETATIGVERITAAEAQRRVIADGKSLAVIPKAGLVVKRQFPPPHEIMKLNNQDPNDTL